MKRKITKQSLAELAKVMPVVPEWEMKQMVGGTGGYVTVDKSGNIIVKEISGQLVYVNEDTGEIVGYLPELHVTAITGSNTNEMLNYYLSLGYQYQDPTGNNPVWQGGGGGGSSSSSSSSNIPKAIDVTISSAGILAGIGEYNKRISVGNKTYWQGQNNKWYQSTWGGNQWTGARSLAYNTANMFQKAGRIVGATGIAFNAYLIYDSYQNGDTTGIIQNGLSAAVGIASMATGPVGFLVGAAYFVLG